MVYFELIAGLALLIVGGDLLIRGAADTARHLGISPMLIGITLVGFGTSTPELVASIQAAVAEAPGIAVGNIVGSNIANILLILGVAAVLLPINTPIRTFRRDGSMVFLTAIVFAAIVLFGTLGRVAGAFLVSLLIAYMVYSYYCERNSIEVADADNKPLSPWLSTPLAIGGLILVIIGARLLVFGAVDLARLAGVSETIVGLTIVAIGTSLPELVTAVVAAIKRQSDIAFGNIIGSNIYNVLGIMGITALVHPIEIPIEIAHVDIWVMMAATLALIVCAVTSWRVTRAEGGALLAAYTGYIGYLAYTA